MKKLFAVSVLAFMASCSGHHAYAMDISKERPSALIEEQRGDYALIEETMVTVQGDVWKRSVYKPAPWLGDQTLKICIKPIKWADYTGLRPICMSIIQQTKLEEGLY